MPYPGYVAWLTDGTVEFPHFVFSADTDMPLVGLFSLTALNRRELVLAEASPGEALDAAAARVRETLGRDDLRLVSLLRREDPSYSVGGPFQALRARWRQTPSKCFYSTLDGNGESLVLREESAQSFIANGGLIQRAQTARTAAGWPVAYRDLVDRKYTGHQVLRGAKPDAEKFNVMYVIKNVSKLRATYQIRLLAFKAVSDGKKLVLRVPAHCEFSPSLERLIKTCERAVAREDA